MFKFTSRLLKTLIFCYSNKLLHSRPVLHVVFSFWGFMIYKKYVIVIILTDTADVIWWHFQRAGWLSHHYSPFQWKTKYRLSNIICAIYGLLCCLTAIKKTYQFFLQFFFSLNCKNILPCVKCLIKYTWGIKYVYVNIIYVYS